MRSTYQKHLGVSFFNNSRKPTNVLGDVFIKDNFVMYKDIILPNILSSSTCQLKLSDYMNAVDIRYGRDYRYLWTKQCPVSIFDKAIELSRFETEHLKYILDNIPMLENIKQTFEKMVGENGKQEKAKKLLGMG